MALDPVLRGEVGIDDPDTNGYRVLSIQIDLRIRGINLVGSKRFDDVLDDRV